MLDHSLAKECSPSPFASIFCIRLKFAWVNVHLCGSVRPVKALHIFEVGNYFLPPSQSSPCQAFRDPICLCILYFLLLFIVLSVARIWFEALSGHSAVVLPVCFCYQLTVWSKANLLFAVRVTWTADVCFVCSVKIFLPSLIELSGSSSQHEDAQSIHAGWDASILQEIINNYIMYQF